MYSFCRFRENIIIKLEKDFKWMLMNKEVIMEFYVNIEDIYIESSTSAMSMCRKS